MSTQNVPSTSARSVTGSRSQDRFGLGSTPGQRGAEILAGLRANQSATPENMALSRMSGRIIARVMLGMIRDKLPLNFTLARPMVFDGLIRKSLMQGYTDPVVVEIACGLAPRGLHLAQNYPNIQVIEVDLPDVVEEKQKRLDKAGIKIPANMRWLTADLAVTPLSDVLGSQKAHVVSAEGLLPYLRHEQIEQLGGWVVSCLHPGGTFIADTPLREGVRKIQQLASFFSRQAGNWYGVIDDMEAGKALLTGAGFAEVETHIATEFAEEFSLPMPMIDVSCFFVARTATESSGE